MRAAKETKAEKSPLRLLIWTAIAGLIFGLIGFGEIAEDTLRAARNSLHSHEASGEIVLVKIDDESLRQVGRWPWPRRYHAELTDALTEAGVNRIFFDLGFFGPTNPTDDRQFAAAITRSDRVVLAARTREGPSAGALHHAMPLPMLAKHAQVVTISWKYNYQNAVWRLPFSGKRSGTPLPSFSAALANRLGPREGTYVPDYSIDPRSIPSFSAADIIDGSFDPALIRGKDVVIGATSDGIGDQYFVPGTGRMGGAYIHILGAETLRTGVPLYLGWIPLFVLSFIVAALTCRGSSRVQLWSLGILIIGLLTGPAVFEAQLIILDVMPALFIATVIGAALIRRHFEERGLINAVSGLPNLSALCTSRAGRKQAVIATRILNYAEIIATLPPDSERQFVDQIVSRLKVGAPERILYHGDDGIFAWFEEARQPFGHHLDALYALFRNPARVGGLSVDLSISFGVEIGSSRSLANRLASALVAAEEAAHDGLKWKHHDPETLQDASWKLSMLSQLDHAVDEGQIWVAYQPKLDLTTRQIIGAEALARWTHPDKGPIAASEFIAAAEQHDRIGKLTDFVLDKAIAAAAALNRNQEGFGMAVNLSARLLIDKGFTLRLAATLARHGLPAERLTLELTETAALAGSGSGIDMLAALRDLGVTISIDDYGTGLSTLDYLKKIPASEIKIDQSFVKSMLDHRSDRVMVQSTIALAHSLDRKVVAEGVESREVLEALTAMKCDIAQGFIIGRPMSFESIEKRIRAPSRRHVA